MFLSLEERTQASKRRERLGRIIQISYTIRPISIFKFLRKRKTFVFGAKNIYMPNKKGWPSHTKFNIAFGQRPKHIKFCVGSGRIILILFIAFGQIFLGRIVLCFGGDKKLRRLEFDKQQGLKSEYRHGLELEYYKGFQWGKTTDYC